MPNDKITAVGANIAEKAAMIWNVADMLRGPFKPHEYGLVILPMTVVKRFHDCLLPTHQAVLDTYEKVKKLQVIDGFLQKASGYQFYNTSRFTFETLLADPDNIESNFRDYLSGFSANAQDVLAKAGKQGQDGDHPKRLSPVQRRRRQRPQQHPAVYSGKRLAGLHHPAFHRYVHEHRHLHLHLGAQQG